MNTICVASHHTSIKALLADPEFRELAALGAANGILIELRLDQYHDFYGRSLSRALKELGPQNLVITYRSPAEGGKGPAIHPQDYSDTIMLAAAHGAAWMDLEYNAVKDQRKALLKFKALKNMRTKFVISYHDFEGVPSLEELRSIRRGMEECGADAAKIAVFPKTIQDSLPLLELLGEKEGWNVPFLGLAMGEAGFWSRVLAPRFPHPAPFTFARAEGSPGTAPGQPTWRLLRELYRYPEIQPNWPVYGVIGNPIGHSLSPLMHNQGLKGAGLPGVYLPFKVESDPVQFAQEIAPRLGVLGLSVTIPHKEAIRGACAELEPLAKEVEAVNTLVRAGNVWIGRNSDAFAASKSLETALGGEGALKDKSVLILGAGGAARAVAVGVKALGANVLVFNRTQQKAEDLAKAVNGKVITREDLVEKKVSVAALVNTTPLGMYPNVNQMPLEENEIPEGCIVFDTVYNPFRTQLLETASRRGLKTLEGLAMFIGQGAAQFEWFTGRPAPRENMERVVREVLVKKYEEQKK